MKLYPVALLLLSPLLLSADDGKTCAGKPQQGLGGVKNSWALDGSGIAAYSKMNINFDGYAKAYNPGNFAAGAILHLCNAGRVYLPDGTSYEGSKSNTICKGQFMDDFKRIGDAGWKDSSVGAIHWYGIVGVGTATVHGKTVSDVQPVLQKDGSGFYVSPTSLQDHSVKDDADQSKYVNAVEIPAAVVPGNLASKGIAMGTFGVAVDINKNIPVPFVVGDGGPAIGEGSSALARLVAGQPIQTKPTFKDRTVGQVDKPDVLWIFFGGHATLYDHNHADQLVTEAKQAYDTWGGDKRLKACLAVVPKN